MTARTGVVVVGSLHYDIMVRAPYLPRAGETLIGERWWWKSGGKGGNQAVAAARHGAATELVGALGDDDFGARLRERLHAAGVGLANVRTVARGSGMSVAVEQADGDYAAVVVSGANRDVDAAAVRRVREVIERSAVLLLQNEIDGSASAAASRIARDAGVTVIHNAAPVGPLEGATGPDEILADILVVNAVEAEQLGAGPVDDLRSAARAASSLRARASTVVVTAGAAGVAAATPDVHVVMPAHAIERAHSHGAGDVFVGALGARLALGDDVEDGLRYANAAAALHVGAADQEDAVIGPADVRSLLGSAQA